MSEVMCRIYYINKYSFIHIKEFFQFTKIIRYCIYSRTISDCLNTNEQPLAKKKI